MKRSSFSRSLLPLGALVLPVALAFPACSDDVDSVATDAGAPRPSVDAADDATLAAEDAGLDARVRSDADVGEHCANSFGGALTGPFGRLDGTLLALVVPGNETCAQPNGDHVVVQILAHGEAYRIVVNVQSDRGTDVDVRFRSHDHPLVGPAFEEGWHAGLALDYVTDLGVHSTDSEWRPESLAALVKRIEDAVWLDEPFSAYASTGGGDSAHLVHRNRNARDGALVVDPTSPTPHWLLFHFAEQAF